MTLRPRSSLITLRTATMLCALLASALAGCGGSDNGGVFVSSMSATPTQYSRPMTVALSGSGLDKGVSLKADSGCGEATEVAGGDAQTRRFTCTVTALGTHTVRAYAPNGLEVARLQFTVPEPEVTLTLTGLGTTLSTIVMRLDPVKAPLSTDNFLAYVNAGFYRSVIFHRVVKDFVIQAGGFTAGPTVKTVTNAAVKLESNNGLPNVRGSVGVARASDPNSGTSQFYINTVDNPALNYKSETEPGYAIFGQVITGLDVVDQIAAVPVSFNLATGLTHLPQSNITIVLATQTK